MPIESEKNACPSATSTVEGVTFEKSGRKRNRTPSPPPGISSEWIDSTIRMSSSSGMRILAERSMPFCTPKAITKWVASTKRQVYNTGRQGLLMNVSKISLYSPAVETRAKLPVTECTMYSAVQPETTK